MRKFAESSSCDWAHDRGVKVAKNRRVFEADVFAIPISAGVDDHLYLDELSRMARAAALVRPPWPAQQCPQFSQHLS
jgi:tellurite resistance protein